MFDSLHDVHFVFHLLIENAVLHKLALVEFFRGVGVAGELEGHLMNGSESASADFAHAVVLVGAVPRSWQPVGGSTISLPPTAVLGLGL